jgi:hypothetical protein
MDALLARLEPVLASQHGLVTIDQLRDAEVSTAQRQRLVERRILRASRPRVYALVGAPETWERGLLALVLSVDDAVASHASAARLWGFALRPEDRYEITMSRDRFARVEAARLHRSTRLDADEVTTRHGIRCTSFERTICDCTTLLSTFQLGRVLDDGLRRGLASLPRLERCAQRLESAPGRRMSVVRWLLAERGVGFDPGGSRSELDVLAVIRRAGLPEPVQQHRVRVGSKTYRPDFAWPAARAFAEYYGTPFHTGASAVVADSRRLTDLSAAGWLPLVFTYASTDAEIVERIAHALQQRGVGIEFSA